MAFDYKKEYKKFYMPKNKPGIIEISKMNYIAVKGLDYSRKEDMHFISMIRLPDFVMKDDFDWAVEESTKKEKAGFFKS